MFKFERFREFRSGHLARSCSEKNQLNMPRVSHQTFTDSNTKVVNAYGPGDGGKGGGKVVINRTEFTMGSSAGANSGDFHKVVINRTEFTMGSSAGANSGDFHKYIGARNRERERVEELDKSAELAEERQAFTAKVQQNKLEADERTRKNAEKRKKKKEKEVMRKKMRKTEDSHSNDGQASIGEKGLTGRREDDDNDGEDHDSDHEVGK
ncbi:DUF1168 domain-containing protein [archaeon]|nr:MAG: DUF1168 domain-containing protein [archaeon]